MGSVDDISMAGAGRYTVSVVNPAGQPNHVHVFDQPKRHRQFSVVIENESVNRQVGGLTTKT